MLGAFRCWLEQTASTSAPAADQPPPEQPPDLHTLLAQFVALRHEVNLQTRASRALQEQNSETLRQLSEALELLERRGEAAAQAQEQGSDEQLRPLLKTLIDLHDNLSLARREVQRAGEALTDSLATLEQPPENAHEPEPPPPTPPTRGGVTGRSLWSRLFGGATPPAEAAAPNVEEVVRPWREVLARQRERVDKLARERDAMRQATGRIRLSFDSVVMGYTMSLQRLERALQQHGLEPIPCLGEPFDPETMEAVEVVPGTGRVSTEVIEEVRRGYRWRGRVFRYAQVRVAKAVRSEE